MSRNSGNRSEASRVRSLRGRFAARMSTPLSFRAQSRNLHLPSFRAQSTNLAVLLFVLPFLAAEAQSTAKAEQALVNLENDWTTAVIKRDVKLMERLTAPKWVYSDESGVMERVAGIKAFTSGPDTVKKASNENMRVFVYGKSAVVIGILRLEGRGAKGAFDNRYRYTDTWVLIGGQWRCVASQDYLMPAKR